MENTLQIASQPVIEIYPLQLWMLKYWGIIYPFCWGIFFATFVVVLWIFLIKPHYLAIKK